MQFFSFSFSYACSKSGHIFQIDFARVSVVHIRRLLPSGKHVQEKSTFGSGKKFIQWKIISRQEKYIFIFSNNQDGLKIFLFILTKTAYSLELVEILGRHREK